jgi:hypothetical protein
MLRRVGVQRLPPQGSQRQLLQASQLHTRTQRAWRAIPAMLRRVEGQRLPPQGSQRQLLPANRPTILKWGAWPVIRAMPRRVAARQPLAVLLCCCLTIIRLWAAWPVTPATPCPRRLTLNMMTTAVSMKLSMRMNITTRMIITMITVMTTMMTTMTIMMMTMTTMIKNQSINSLRELRIGSYSEEAFIWRMVSKS